jgi:hypothetical protein
MSKRTGCAWSRLPCRRRRLHPLILFDANGQSEPAAQEFGADSCGSACVGGVLTGGTVSASRSDLMGE